MKIMLDDGALLPTRAHKEDAGLDLFSREEQIILPGESAVFDTGVHVELPPGTFGKLESKSGLNVNYNIVSCGGVIDSGYTGSIRVKLYNLGEMPYMIRKGQKIVQMIIQPYLAPEMEVVDKLSETDRGENGFGSTDSFTSTENRQKKNEKVTPIEAAMKHKVSEVICLCCLERWIAVRPEGVLLKELECPNGDIGYVIETGETGGYDD